MFEILWKEVKGMVEQIKNLFKYKSEQVVKHNNKKSQLLRKESVKLNSIVDIDLEEGIVSTVNKVKGKIYQYSFVVPIGLDPLIDAENKRLLTKLLNACNGKVKIWLLNENKRQLKENMELLKERVQVLDDESSLSDVCVNRYQIMQTLEKINYSTGYIFVDEENNLFEEIAQSFLNLYQLMDQDLLNFIERMNNDPLGGDSFVFG